MKFQVRIIKKGQPLAVTILVVVLLQLKLPLKSKIFVQRLKVVVTSFFQLFIATLHFHIIKTVLNFCSQKIFEGHFFYAHGDLFCELFCYIVYSLTSSAKYLRGTLCVVYLQMFHIHLQLRCTILRE